MPSIKVKVARSENDQNNDKKISDEDFNRALKTFQKLAQETKRQTKKHEFFTPTKDVLRAKRNAAKKNKRRK